MALALMIAIGIANAAVPRIMIKPAPALMNKARGIVARANIKNVAIYAPDMITPRTISPPAMSRVIAVRAATAPNIKHGVMSARAAIWIVARSSASVAAVPMTAGLIISNATAR